MTAMNIASERKAAAMKVIKCKTNREILRTKKKNDTKFLASKNTEKK